ncbi:hypothetical protein C8R41DRAFT_332957 [Lentinula lateritia]|uniref:Telomere-associated protein Rif1 N-terminal domain-containing protein n=1 Tax=Lentinula lateritia TaxID=40482 RepID=A0ABQ8VG21_9AGAR|nr:hypothetical protein C8R41DRAFT_332957 [Lentinula lateritia]
MSLPTPPTTSHREKEHRTLGSRSHGVLFSKENRIHSLSAPPQGPSCSSALQTRPRKSILKPTQPLLPLPQEEIREETPEPVNPLDDPNYLQTPISTIISQSATLPELIRAYSVLTARIRPYVNDWTDCSSPLFKPLRANSDVLCDRVCRDVRRALENALTEDDDEEVQKEYQLPSPIKSPKKKKRGMTAEQAKHARDLCNICHSVLKFLGFLFSLPNLSPFFTVRQRTEMLSGILSIPLATDLPTPNARKTYALSIYVIQSLRLPDTVLLPARDSIAFALGRGIDGELGKEGKKGSASDGLKAIHDLAIYQPATFVPAFVILTDSILRNLLAPTLTLRVQACHALGGLAQGVISIPLSHIHSRVSLQIVQFLLTPSTRASPKKKSGSPTLATQESDICRTLRTTLNTEDPLHVAQGPVWALHVLGCFIVLLGSAFKTDMRLVRTITNLLTLTMRHKKVAVRKLACVVWRSITWSWHQLPLPSLGDEECTAVPSKSEQQMVSKKQWCLIELVLNMGVGVGTCCAIVGNELGPAERIRLERILTLMMNRGDDSRDCALRCIKQLVSLEQRVSSWDIDNLLSRNFLSGIPGVLNADYQDLTKPLQNILEELPHVRDLRPLNKDELLELDTMGLFLELWGSAIGIRNGPHNNEDLLIETWDAILKAVTTLAEDEDDEAESKAALNLCSTLYDSLRMGSKEESKTSDSDGHTMKQEQNFDLGKKLRMVRRAWTSLCNVLPNGVLADYGTQLLAQLVQSDDDELSEIDDSVREEWAALCVDLVLSSEDSSKVLSAFWTQVDSKWNWSATVRTIVWTKFVQTWQESKRDTWDGSLVLLSAPFCSVTVWDLNNDELSTWERFLAFIVNRGFDYGYDCVAVVGLIAERLQEKCNPTFTSLTRIADMLMTHARDSFREILNLPESLMDFIADTLNQSYPPSPSTGFSSLWMIRSLGHLIDACPEQLCLSLLETLQESIVLWISDERSGVTDSYDDIVTFYENYLMRLAEVISPTQEYMQQFAPILDAIFIGPQKPVAAFDAFETFWHTTQFSVNVPPQAWPKKVYEYIYGAPAISAAPSPKSPYPVEETHVGEDTPEEGVGSVVSSKESRTEEASSLHDSEPCLFNSAPLCSPALEFPASPHPTHSGQFEAENAESDIRLLLPAPPILSTPPRASRAKLRIAEALNSPPPRPHTPGESSLVFARRFDPLFSPKTPSSKSKHVPQLALSPIIKPLPPASPVASPNKKRRVSDSNKENLSPCPTRYSPQYRGRDVQSSPSRLLSRNDRKRTFDSEDGSPCPEQVKVERPTKRVRISTPIPPLALPLPAGPTSSSLQAADFDLALCSPSSSSKAMSSKSSSPSSSSLDSTVDTNNAATLCRTTSISKKRKALLMDCVEIVRITPSKLGQAMKTPTHRMTREVSISKRKTVTMASPVQGPDAEGDSDPEFLNLSMSSESDSDYGSDPDNLRSEKQLSSDDDPHLGQVTPGHLISPTLRRVRGLHLNLDGETEAEDELPSSDDSDCSFSDRSSERRSRQLSPSREVVLRRIQRSLSGTARAVVTPCVGTREYST